MTKRDKTLCTRDRKIIAFGWIIGGSRTFYILLVPVPSEITDLQGIGQNAPT